MLSCLQCDHLVCLLITTRTNQVGEYNTMHVSLGFIVYSNHPCPWALPSESGDHIFQAMHLSYLVSIGLITSGLELEMREPLHWLM